MRDADGGVRRVDALPAGAARAERVDAQIFLVDLDVDLFSLGQDRHRRRRRVDASARFRGRDALHTVDAALVLQLAVHPAALDRRDAFLEPADAGVAARHHVDLPALPLGVLAVHPEQLAGEQGRLVAARAGADLEDDVLLIVGILRDEKDLQIADEGVAPGGEGFQLFLRQLAHVGIAAGDHFFGLRNLGRDGLVLAVLLDERLQLRQRLRVLAHFVRIRLYLGRAKQARQLVVAIFFGSQFVKHNVGGAKSPAPHVRRPFQGRRSSSRHRRQECNLVAVVDFGVHARVVRVERARHRALVLGQAGKFAGQLLPHRPDRRAGRDVSRHFRGAGDVAEPREQPHGHAHAIRSASARARWSSGSAVAPSIQTSPPSKYSRFHTGTICFTRSIT